MTKKLEEELEYLRNVAADKIKLDHRERQKINRTLIASARKKVRTKKSANPESKWKAQQAKNKAWQSKKKPKLEASHQTYIIYCEKLNCVKIGRTKRIRSRFAGIQNAIPAPIKLLAVFDGAEKELRLHQKFKTHRIYGEWYEAPPVLAALKLDPTSVLTWKEINS